MAELRAPLFADSPIAPRSQKVLAVGEIGSGKTSQVWTLPGRKFAYLFDPNAEEALEGCPDLEYLSFAVTPEDINIAARALKKGSGEAELTRQGGKRPEPRTYIEFLRDFQEREKGGYFKDFAWVVVDSYTTLSDIVMDRVRYLGGNLFAGQPQQEDYGPEMEIIKNLTRTFANLGTNLYFTAHTERRQDKESKLIGKEVMLTGRNRKRIPALFSHIFGLHYSEGKFLCATRPDGRENPLARTHIRGLQPVEDVTIDWRKPVVGQGLARLLAPVLKKKEETV